MLNRISAVVLTILLFLISWWSISGLNPSSLTVFSVSLALFIICTFIVNWRRLGFSWPHLLLPCFYLAGVGSIFVVLTNPTWRTVFIVLACLMFYIIELQLGRESHFLQNIFLFSVFAILVGLFAVQFYFHISYFLLAPVVFIVTYFLIVQGFAGFSLPAKKYFSFLTALVCAECAWGLSLWPTYYVVDAIIVFAVFYLLWIFSFSAFFGKLTRSKIYLQLSLVAIIILAVLITANFRPLTR
jgi:hypothetical protein